MPSQVSDAVIGERKTTRLRGLDTERRLGLAQRARCCRLDVASHGVEKDNVMAAACEVCRVSAWPAADVGDAHMLR
jgi:hypothetical protein